MSTLLQVAPHLSDNEVTKRFKACKHPTEKLRWQAIMLKGQGWATAQIAQACATKPDWVRRTVRRYNRDGPEGVKDRRKQTGRKPLLDDEGQAELRKRLDKPPPDGGVWNGPKVAAWISQKVGRNLTPWTGWSYLRRLGYRLKVPRTHHPDADKASQKFFKEKALKERLAEVSEAHPDAEVQIWAQDEARVGLIPTLRRVWSAIGTRPVASSRRRYKWRYLYSFVHPATGEVVNVIGTTVNTEAMSEVLAHFAKSVGAGPKRQVIVVLDGAGWHRSKRLVVPEGVHLEFLPARSPELQPAERLWPLINEGVANRLHETLDELLERVSQRCQWMDGARDLIRGLTKYHWWPDDVPQPI